MSIKPGSTGPTTSPQAGPGRLVTRRSGRTTLGGYGSGNAQGCVWSGADGCSGTPLACAEQSSPANCTAAGCTYSECAGDATDCAELDETACATQPGCSWE